MNKNSHTGLLLEIKEDLSHLRVSVARLEERVKAHDRGLSAVGAMLIAAISGLLTQFVFRLFHK